MLFQKRNGIFLSRAVGRGACLRRERQESHRRPDPHVVIQLRTGNRVVAHALRAVRAVQNSTLGTGTTHAIDVSDYVTMLELKPSPGTRHARSRGSLGTVIECD